MHSDLLYHVVTEGGDLTGDWDGPTGEAQTQSAISCLTTCVNLPLDSHCNDDISVTHYCSTTRVNGQIFKSISIHSSPAKRLLEPPATCTTLSADRVSEKDGTLICEQTERD